MEDKATKHTGGRPTKYNDETIQKVKHYLKNYKDEDDMMPSIAGLACYLDISRETVYDWSNQPEKQEFSDMLKKILVQQERVLLNNGLSGVFNAAITKLALTKHNYSDKVDSDMTTGGKEISNNFIIQPVRGSD